MLPSSVPVSLKIFEDLKSQQCPKVCCIARPRLWEIISLNIRWCDSSPSSSADSSVMFSRLVIYVVLLCFASLSWPTFFLVENCSSWWWLQCDVVQEVAGCCRVLQCSSWSFGCRTAAENALTALKAGQAQGLQDSSGTSGSALDS